MADSGHVTSAQHIHGYCGLWVARCGTVAVVENGGFARLEPDPAHPTDQALCAKGRAAPELVCHSERLTSASPASNRRQSDSLDARAPRSVQRLFLGMPRRLDPGDVRHVLATRAQFRGLEVP